MKNNRRNFLKNTVAAGSLGVILPSEVFSIRSRENEIVLNESRPKILFFDINETILDLEPLKKSISTVLHNRAELATLWFTTMLQYSLVVTVASQYEDFGAIGVATLQMVAKNNNIEISKEKAQESVKPILSLKPHTDVIESLKKLKNNGYRLVSFTNSSNYAVKTQLKNAAIDSYFEEQLSIEDIGKFKPHADAYNWAARKMNVKNNECMLIAAHGWDIAGALYAGWRGAFIGRPGQQLFSLAPNPELNEVSLLTIANKLCALK
ncbi:haloacid dehalogenase type II [Flavobacterium qiangtangense]|uniref:Haloacid dehalogenase type II n=1 Tax=Flavobacterium qiangtangense TaxID=1442595 RepID=A0ABW1PN49_9FLAO